LPEAQLDRFLMKTVIDYPTPSEEIEIMKRFTNHQDEKIEKVLDKEDIFKLIELVDQIYVSDNIFGYVKDIIFTSRFPEKY
jgi:MoxR-like ATPase